MTLRKEKSEIITFALQIVRNQVLVVLTADLLLLMNRSNHVQRSDNEV